MRVRGQTQRREQDFEGPTGMPASDHPALCSSGMEDSDPSMSIPLSCKAFEVRLLDTLRPHRLTANLAFRFWQTLFTDSVVLQEICNHTAGSHFGRYVTEIQLYLWDPYYGIYG